jgi:hypothetical protein
MPLTLEVRGRDDSVKEQRRAWAARVIEYFSDKLPTLRLLVFVDDTDAPTLTTGPTMRGRFQPTSKQHFNATCWPRVLAEKLRTININAPESTFHYDAVIYVPDSTCNGETNEASLTMTPAHELQHFIQYGSNRDLWAWNTVPGNLLKTTITRLGLKWRDIPIEYEARVVAKRAAQTILGEKRTAGYIECRINERVTDSDADDWQFIQGIDTSSTGPFDCAAKTQELFQRLVPVRNELEQALDNSRRLPEFANLNLDEMMNP